MFVRNNRSKLSTFAYGVFLMLRQKEKWFINFLFIIFQKCMSVGPYRMIESAVNTKLYINSKILRAVYLDSFSDFLTLILISTRSTS